MVKPLSCSLARRAGNQRGSILVETLVALALLGFLGGAFLSALTTSSRAAAITDEMVNTDNLARAQMEYTKYSAYVAGSPDVLTYARVDDSNNPDHIAVPVGYSIAIVGHALNQPDDGIQEITVTVTAGSKSTVLKGYKVNR